MPNIIPISCVLSFKQIKPLLSIYHAKVSDAKFRKNLSQTYENMRPKTWQFLQILEIYFRSKSLVSWHSFFLVNIGKFGVTYSMCLEYPLDCYEERGGLLPILKSF